MWKRYNFEGGVADPLMVSWPKGIKAKGEIRHQYNHATDVVPTLYECLGIELPDVVKGFTQIPLEGTSFKYSFDDGQAPTQKETGFFVMLGSRAIWHKGWKAVTVHPTIAGWDHYAADRWELYNTDEDPTEVHDLAAQYPEKLQELIQLWFYEAGKYNGLPLEDRTAVEVLTVGSAPIRTQPGSFSLVGEGLCVGRDGGEPVTKDYAGNRPWAFVGGVIKEVVVDVSGEPFMDLEHEATMAFMRD